MEKVTVKVQDLLKEIKENKENHIKVYELAFSRYKVKLIEHLEKLLTDIKEGKDQRYYISVSKPESNVRYYDLAIKMLEMSTEELVTISFNDFSKFVMDDWDWKYDFVSGVSHFITEGELPPGCKKAMTYKE